jgi:sensor histidine kinase YesM
VLLLQPIIENAIEHGATDDSCTTVTLQAARTDGVLEITVEDSGPGIPVGEPVREGIGLRNTRARLQELYGAGASVELGPARHSVAGGGARVVMRFPVASISS